MSIRFITPGGKPGTYNVYFYDWTCKINAKIDVTGHEITDFETVNAVYKAEHPEEEETDDYI